MAPKSRKIKELLVSREIFVLYIPVDINVIVEMLTKQGMDEWSDGMVRAESPWDIMFRTIGGNQEIDRTVVDFVVVTYPPVHRS
jgi:hypothetical protein